MTKKNSKNINVKFDILELELLRSIIGKTLISFSCGTYFFPDEQCCYGKLYLKFSNKVIEVDNFLLPVEMNPGMDEAAMMTFSEFEKDNTFNFLLNEVAYETQINETVKAVRILENTVKVYSQEDCKNISNIVFNNAVEIKTDKHSYCLYSDDLFSERINFTSQCSLKMVTTKDFIIDKFDVNGLYDFIVKQKIIKL